MLIFLLILLLKVSCFIVPAIPQHDPSNVVFFLDSFYCDWNETKHALKNHIHELRFDSKISFHSFRSEPVSFWESLFQDEYDVDESSSWLNRSDEIRDSILDLKPSDCSFSEVLERVYKELPHRVPRYDVIFLCHSPEIFHNDLLSVTSQEKIFHEHGDKKFTSFDKISLFPTELDIKVEFPNMEVFPRCNGNDPNTPYTINILMSNSDERKIKNILLRVSERTNPKSDPFFTPQMAKCEDIDGKKTSNCSLQLNIRRWDISFLPDFLYINFETWDTTYKVAIHPAFFSTNIINSIQTPTHILLVGSFGAGKTTLLNIMESILSQKPNLDTKKTCTGYSHCTNSINSHSMGHIAESMKDFYITDTRGFDIDELKTTYPVDFLNALIKGDLKNFCNNTSCENQKLVDMPVHSIIMVVDNSIDAIKHNQQSREQFKNFIDALHLSDRNIIFVVTHWDMLQSDTQATELSIKSLLNAGQSNFIKGSFTKKKDGWTHEAQLKTSIILQRAICNVNLYNRHRNNTL